MPLIYILFISILNMLRLNSYIIALLTILFLIALDLNQKNQTKTLIFTAFAPSYITIQIIILYSIIKFIILKKELKKDINYKIMLGYIFLIIVSYSVSMVKEGTLIPIILYFFISVCIYSVYFIFRSEDNIQIEDYYYLCIFQIIPVSYQIINSIINGTYFPDIIIGTTNECNMLVVFLVIYLILIICNSNISNRCKIINFIIYGSIILAAEAKVLLVIFIISILFVFVLLKKYRNKFLKLAIIMFSMSGIIIMLIVSLNPFIKLLTGYQISEYINNDSTNMKFRAYKYTFTELNFLEDIIGVGVGRYGSKTANALAYDTMYKYEDTLKLPTIIKPITNEKYKYIASMMTKEFYENIKWISGILSYPQCSIITIKGELGYSGLIILIIFFIKNYVLLRRNIKYEVNISQSYCAIIFLIFLLCANFFDNFLEMNNLILIFSFILASAYSNNNLGKCDTL